MDVCKPFSERREGTYVETCAHMCRHVHRETHVHVCVSVYIYRNVYGYLHICLYVCMHAVFPLFWCLICVLFLSFGGGRVQFDVNLSS